MKHATFQRERNICILEAVRIDKMERYQLPTWAQIIHPRLVAGAVR